MSYLQAYRDEHTRYPNEQRIHLSPSLAEKVTCAVAKFHGLRVRVLLNTRTNGKCWGFTIALPTSGCSLGMIYHEVAHAYDRQKYNHVGHTGSFTNALGIIYHHTRPAIRRLLLAAKSEVDAARSNQMEQASRLAKKEITSAERKQKARELRESRSYRITKTEQRIRRLESKAKRLQTLLRSAKRSLVHLKRWENANAKTEMPSLRV